MLIKYISNLFKLNVFRNPLEHIFSFFSKGLQKNIIGVKGISNMLFEGTGFFIDRFHCTNSEGILWLHGYGNVFEKTLAPGEQSDIEPDGWLYKDPDVRMETKVQSLSTGFLAGINIVMNRFTGPDRIGIQSMYLHMITSD